MPAFVRTTGAALLGADAVLVDVQVSVTLSSEGGERVFRIVGLPDSALREGRERIRAAVTHGGHPWPFHTVTVNLAPAEARKEGAGLDLPIALAILSAQGSLGPDPRLDGWLCLGELTLDGQVRPTRGVLAAVEAARRRGIRRALVHPDNALEAAAVGEVEVYPVGHLDAAAGHLGGWARLEPVPAQAWQPAPWAGQGPCPVRGQPVAVRAARIAATGGHNLLLVGPPGAGKTLLARHLSDLMPPLTRTEAMEASRIHSAAGLLSGGLLGRRPFRAPHHTTSVAGLVGGGRVPKPGEVSLAHGGVLFLDEFPEFPRLALDALRQPIEDGEVTIGRAAGRAEFPARCLVVAAMNPCPCGWHGVPNRCRCGVQSIERYQARVSGPLRDRFDLCVTVTPVDPAALLEGGEEAALTLAQVTRARERQEERARRLGLSPPWNARLPARVLPAAAECEPAARRRLVHDSRRLGLSGRGMHRVLRVARTIADLDDDTEVREAHLLEALALRT